MKAADTTITLDREALKAIRRALITGLDCFGEIERVLEHVEMLKLVGEAVPEGVIPAHPTGLNDTISDFVSAFRYLEIADTADSAMGAGKPEPIMSTTVHVLAVDLGCTQAMRRLHRKMKRALNELEVSHG